MGGVEDVGSEVRDVKPGQFVVGSFFASDNTCGICGAGYQTHCVNRQPAAATGAQVYNGAEPSRMVVALVRFTPGAHTNWHRHAVGQTLHVTEGVGLVGTRDGTVVRVLAGDTVVCPPDEEHWHGAAADTFMSRLALLEALPGGENPTTWLEPVADEAYQAANSV